MTSSTAREASGPSRWNAPRLPSGTSVARELYLPKSLTDNRWRCHAVKIPDKPILATKSKLATAIVPRPPPSPLPIEWVPRIPPATRSGAFRRIFEEATASCVLAVQSPQHSYRFGHTDHLFTQHQTRLGKASAIDAPHAHAAKAPTAHA